MKVGQQYKSVRIKDFLSICIFWYTNTMSKLHSVLVSLRLYVWKLSKEFLLTAHDIYHELYRMYQLQKT